MTEMEIGTLIGVTTLVVLMAGIPIAYGLTATAVVFMLIFSGPESLIAVPRVFFEEINGFAILALPMFILLGSVVGSSRASSDIHEAAHRWMRRIPGGLVIANILACGLFSAICGSSPATAAAIGRSGIPEMRARGVPSRLAAGAICAGGTLGILIPPSITMILYGIATGTSIGKLFMAGVVPGIMLVAMFSFYAAVVSAGKTAAPQPGGASVEGPTWRVTARVMPFLALIVLVLVALYGGFATPSEGASLAAFLAVLMAFLIYRPSLSQWKHVGAELIRDSSMLLLIIAASGLFSYMLSLLYVTQSFGELLIGAHLDRWVFFLLVSTFLLVAGCFVPPAALILVVMPIIQPSLEAYHFDLIWFGVIMTILMEIGLIHPPVGVNLFVIRAIAPDLSLQDIFYGSMPFLILMLVAVALFAIFPELVTWLPTVMQGA
jgi:tripartite ATP-independent transporter DctM subunit